MARKPPRPPWRRRKSPGFVSDHDHRASWDRALAEGQWYKCANCDAVKPADGAEHKLKTGTYCEACYPDGMAEDAVESLKTYRDPTEAPADDDSD